MTDKNEQIVRLKDTEGLSWGEIGERTGLSAEAARSRYRNQRKRIELQESPGILEAAENLGILDMIKLKGGWLKSKDA